MIRVTENFRKIQDLLAQAVADAGRPPGSVTLLAASKTRSPATVRAAADCGQRDFGENFAREGIDKMAGVGRDDLVWHFIGRLQSNKTRAVAEHFDWVHTVDRLKIAERLSAQRPAEAAPLEVCIQVNVDDEEAKSGARPGDVVELAASIARLPHLRLRGLMCIPAVRESFEEQREPFARMRELLAAIQAEGIDVDTLSMGMSGDFDAAIHEGATIVRIGTALFGPRPPKTD